MLFNFKQSEKTLRKLGDEFQDKFRYIVAFTGTLFAFYVVSYFFVTLDRIQDPIIRVLYILSVAALIVIATLFVLRGILSPAKPAGTSETAVPRVRLHPESAQAFSTVKEVALEFPGRALDAGGEGEPGEASPSAGSGGDVSVMIVHPSHAGETALRAALTGEIARRSAKDARWSKLGLAVLPPIGDDGAANEPVLAQAKTADLVLFVFDNDLLRGEMEGLRSLIADRVPLILVLNQVDRLRDDEAKELQDSLWAKLADVRRRPPFVTCAPDPLPERLVMRQADGTERVERTVPDPDLGDLMAALDKVLRTAR
ncbi:MAG: hypothetical protein ACFB6R_01330 [Alphaproteobacteria bacterium]